MRWEQRQFWKPQSRIAGCNACRNGCHWLCQCSPRTAKIAQTSRDKKQLALTISELETEFSTETAEPSHNRHWQSQWHPRVRAMVKRSEVIEIMERLDALGATAILETTITNCRL